MAISLSSLVAKAEQLPHYPVDTWYPERRGSIDIEIKTNGEWLHEGSPIQRASLKQLFSRLLVLREDIYWLVTPQEQLQIKVESLPFIIVDAQLTPANIWQLTSNTGEQLRLEDLSQWRWPRYGDCLQASG